ncbi:hypothetical protein DWB63_13115 [Pseudodesulfovibrio sp. S3]|nr:hypothetical protein DWB63_13115 [Pseudodesulfovibrio sp. S3]
MGVLLTAMLIGLIPAFIARSKGRSMGAWWIYGTLLFIIALPHSIFMKNYSTINGKPNIRPCGNPECHRFLTGDQTECWCGWHTSLPSERTPARDEDEFATCLKCGHNQYAHLRICQECRYDRQLDPQKLYSNERECPFCAELIKKKAVKCKHCGSEIEPFPEAVPPQPPEPESLGNEVLDARARLAANAKKPR